DSLIATSRDKSRTRNCIAKSNWRRAVPAVSAEQGLGCAPIYVQTSFFLARSSQIQIWRLPAYRNFLNDPGPAPVRVLPTKVGVPSSQRSESHRPSRARQCALVDAEKIGSQRAEAVSRYVPVWVGCHRWHWNATSSEGFWTLEVP